MPRRVVLAALAFVLGAAAIIAVIVTGNRYLDEMQQACNFPRPPSQPELAWFALPLGIASVALMALSLVLAYVARRDLGGGWSAAATALLPAAVLGLLFNTWFGVVAVLADASRALHCGG